MTQKTIKALYKQPVNYKLIKDGYKTINGIIQARDGMPKVVDLPVPSELYTTDLQYNVDTEVNGAPIITTEQFTLPDNEICEAKEYCYAPKGINYNYTTKQNVRHYDNFTVVGSPNINNNVVSGFSVNDRLQLVNMPTYSAGTITSFEFMFKVHTPETFTANGRLLNDFNSYDDVKLEVSSTGIAFNYGTSSAYIYTNSTPISTNTDYWIRVIYNNGTMSLDYSTNGINYSIAASAEIASNNIQILSSTFDIGARYYGNQDPGCTWAGSIDLSETYIKINNEYYWLPYRDIIEEVTIQIPGILDSSVTTDNWQQSQEYKLYQLKNQNNTDSLQLTENSITDTTQKYKQYINRLTIPARDYKWYYHSIETGVYNNYNVIGSPIVNTTTGVVSGFSTSNYLQLPQAFNPGNNPWEMLFKVRTGSDLQAWQEIFHSSVAPNESGRYGLSAMIDSGNFELDISTSGSSWIGSDHGTFVLSENTDYWVKIGWNSNEYYLEYSTNGADYIRDITYTVSNNLPNLTNSWIGIYRSSDYMYPMLGSIDLSESYIKINGNIWWSPMSMSIEAKWLANKSIYDYSATGLYADTLDFTKSYVGVNDSEYHKYLNPKVCLMPIDGGEETTHLYRRDPNYNISGSVDIDNDLIASNFTTGSYIYSNSVLPNHDTWEYITRFKIISATEKWSCLLSTDSSESFGFDLGIKNNKITWYIKYQGGSGNSISNQGSGNATISNNTWYWIKFGFNGTKYYSKYSTNGINYSLDYEYASETKCTIGSHFNIGTEFRSNEGVFNGYVDLSNTTFSVNNAILWKLKKEYIPGCLYNYNDDGSEHSFDVYYDSNYTQPILVSAGESYSEGTKVDTITIPAHRTWDYQADGNWSPIS